MGTVIPLASDCARVRTLNNVRAAINERARHMHVAEPRRLSAFGIAREVFEAGASSAWAVQAGLQTLRGQRVVRCTPADGGHAA